jgi:hypothetical protein
MSANILFCPPVSRTPSKPPSQHDMFSSSVDDISLHAFNLIKRRLLPGRETHRPHPSCKHLRIGVLLCAVLVHITQANATAIKTAMATAMAMAIASAIATMTVTAKATAKTMVMAMVTGTAMAMAKARGMAMATAMAMETETATAMAMMWLTAKVMAGLVMMRMGMGGRWEAAACSRRLLAVGRRGDKKAASEMVTTRNRVTETLQQYDNQPACKG